MTIKEVYEKFAVTPNLARHMIRVAQVVIFIRDHWTEPKVDWGDVIVCALVHDVGNIVKFDFDKHPEFLGDEVKRLEYWRAKQKEAISKYGPDDNQVTREILQELVIDENLVEVVYRKRFENSVDTLNSPDWLLKILYYSDLRALPTGIGTLEQRLEDIRDRYPKFSTRPDFEDLCNACRELEKQIGRNVDVPLSEISVQTVSGNDEELLSVEV